jgi:glutamate synthase (ferredoxin)
MKRGRGAAPVAAVAAVAAHDLLQRRHALLRNFPVIGHARFWLESIGPELRQYIVAGNDEKRPFSRDQRRWVYASAKLENNYFGFGTDNDLEHSSNNVIVHHRTFGRAQRTHGKPGRRHGSRAQRCWARRAVAGWRSGPTRSSTSPV